MLYYRVLPAGIQSEKPGPHQILVVDDERQIREIVRRLAEGAGYAVTEAETGEAALRILHQLQPPHLMITDIVMPGMSGLMLAAHAHILRPTLPVIFMSGFADQFQDELSGSVCLRKPFKPAELLTAIQEVIGSPHTSTGRTCGSGPI